VKNIAMHYCACTYTIYITSTMTEDVIYNTLHAALQSVIGNYHIVIWDTKLQERAHLHYNDLKEDQPYAITVLLIREQGAGTHSAAIQRTVQNKQIVLKHWKLQLETDMFPHDTAPRAPNATCSTHHAQTRTAGPPSSHNSCVV
jgi:hypothetical protein